MKQGFELFRAHGYNDINGQCAISLGVNFARLGLDRDYILKGYTCRYGEAFFAEFIDGYKNAFNDEYVSKLTQVIIPALDVDFVMTNLRNHKLLKDFIISDIVYEPNEYHSGIRTLTKISMTHKVRQISFDVEYYEYINADSSHSNHWHIDADIKHNLEQHRRFDRNRAIKLEDVIWQEIHRSQGGDNDRYCYEFRGHWNASTPHSSSVAKLIDHLVTAYIKRFNLDNTEPTEKTTLGDLINKQRGLLANDNQ